MCLDMSTTPAPLPHEPEPAWDVARLFPAQGAWDSFDYLQLTHGTNRLIEFSDGQIDVLEMPTTAHQLIVAYLLAALQDFVKPAGLGTVLPAPLRVQIGVNKFREPDLVFLLQEHRDRRGNEFWQGADLVVEVVSDHPKSRERDLRQKPADYAEGRIPEYWIVDPVEESVTVLRLAGDQYVTHGVFSRGEQASSILLDGFTVDVAGVLDAAHE